MSVHTAEQSDAGSWAACPESVSLKYQIGCFDYLQSIKMPGGRLGKHVHDVRAITGAFPSPSGADASGQRSSRSPYRLKSSRT